jgi:hypothetical protein
MAARYPLSTSAPSDRSMDDSRGVQPSSVLPCRQLRNQEGNQAVTEIAGIGLQHLRTQRAKSFWPSSPVTQDQQVTLRLSPGKAGGFIV